MLRFFPNAKRALDSLLILITDLVMDGLLFFRLLFRSRTALSAEVLFLRKQLAFYQERQVQPRRLNGCGSNSTSHALPDSHGLVLTPPVSLLSFWSRRWDWKEALVIVKPEILIGWHRKGFKLFWKGKSQAGRPRIPENIRKLRVQRLRAAPFSGNNAYIKVKRLFAGCSLYRSTSKLNGIFAQHSRSPLYLRALGRGLTSLPVARWTLAVRSHLAANSLDVTEDPKHVATQDFLDIVRAVAAF